MTKGTCDIYQTNENTAGMAEQQENIPPNPELTIQVPHGGLTCLTEFYYIIMSERLSE